ncbi:MAG: VTT domain-containing protein [Candidatus Gracilibacteria bacterium]|nr:VTT domain-containing protein [Candidatus Gracilibacteria bacterium]
MDLNNYLNPQTIAILQTGGYFLMLGLMIVEGPLVTFAAAFLASLGFFDIWIVFVLGWLGDILGDLLFYSIGRYGFHIFTKKTAIDTPQEETFIHKLDQLIHTNLALAILIIKFTPYAPPIGLTYIGKIKVDMKKYIITSLMVCIPVPLVATAVGFHLGYLNTIFTKFSGMELVGALLVTFLVFVLGIGSMLFLQKKTKKVLAAEKEN